MPDRIIFVAGYVLVANFGYAALQVWLLQGRSSWARWLSLCLFVWAGLMGSLFLLQIFGLAAWEPFVRDYLYFPMAIEMVWNVLLLQLLVPGMILAAFFIKRRRRLAAKSAPPLDSTGVTRREFLYMTGCGVAPVLATGMGLHGLATQDDLRVRKFDIPVVGLPPGLEGFTIAHVSDLHSGIFVGPKRLKIMSDATNDQKADLIVVTGDLINFRMEEFSDALASIQRLESRHGLYLCEGNHDVLPGPMLVVEACRRNQLAMLWNESATLSLDGGRLIIGGLPWLSPNPGTPSRMVTDLFPARAEGDVRILLAHHPHFFDVSDQVDLLLSGHTHGGQIMFGDVGLGNLRFKYNSGRFHRGDMTMIVNNGCGDWFPCRIGAPAEVGLLRLTKAV
jgi:predicted MPP superfamily phosphohydrolase